MRSALQPSASSWGKESAGQEEAPHGPQNSNRPSSPLGPSGACSPNLSFHWQSCHQCVLRSAQWWSRGGHMGRVQELSHVDCSVYTHVWSLQRAWWVRGGEESWLGVSSGSLPWTPQIWRAAWSLNYLSGPLLTPATGHVLSHLITCPHIVLFVPHSFFLSLVS